MNWNLAEDRFLLDGMPSVVVFTTARVLSMPVEEPHAGRLRKFVEQAGLRPCAVVGMQQVHEARIEWVKEVRDAILSSCDGLVTDRPGVALVVRTADCLPIVAWDARHRKLGVAHAGWRGVRAGIPKRLVEELGTAELEVGIGPGIGPCCYEVGPEFEAWFPGRLIRREGRLTLDLVSAATDQLSEAGVLPGQIHAAPWCTACSAQHCHSFRREGSVAGRMLTVAMIKGE